MAARQPPGWLRACSGPFMRTLPCPQTRSYHQTAALRSSSSGDATPAPPPLLSTFKQDLKTAMRSKDAPRLAVLRSLISATNNAAKTSSPLSTDVQLVALVRKHLRASREAAAEARDADRPDLAEREDEQGAILESYIAGAGVGTVSEAEVKELVDKIVSEARAATQGGKEVLGRSMKAVKEALSGKDVDVDMKRITELVMQAIGK